MRKHKKISYITQSEVIAIHNDLIKKDGGTHGILYKPTIEFIVQKAKEISSNQSLLEILYWKAAVYLHHIVHWHPFIDGNKRTGMAACETFLDLNGYFLDVDIDTAEKFVMEIAEYKFSLADLEEVKKWIEIYAKPIGLVGRIRRLIERRVRRNSKYE